MAKSKAAPKNLPNQKKPKKTGSKTNKSPDEPKKQISFITIAKKTWLEISSFWRPLLGVTATYAALYFVFVMSFQLNNNVKQLLSTTTGKLPQAFSVITDSMFNSYSGAQSDATTLIQILLFVVATLALVWTLRRLQNLQKAGIRDAFYEGPARLVPVLIVSLILMLTFIPALFGSTILSYALSSGSGGLEIIVASIISLALIFASLLLFVMYWPAFYIVTLPQMYPLKSLKAAAKVTKKYRLSILRKFVMLGIVCILALFIVILPIALIAPIIVPYLLYFVIFGIFMVGQVFLFELYRSLV